MENKAKFIIEVVPLTRIPMSREPSFYYLFEKKIPVGSLVSIPLFKRQVQGIVIGHKDDFARLGSIQLKKISKIIEEDFLPEKQLHLAYFMQDYYMSPLGINLKSFIPKIVKEKKRKEISSENPGKAKEIILTQEQKDAVKKIEKSKKSKFLLFGPSGSGKTEIYIELAKSLAEKKQILILLPELTLTPQAIERYGAHFKTDEIAIINSKISKGKFYSQWKKIKSGEIKVIIGSRMAVFAPFKNLGLIVVDEEQDMSFKQWDMNPRYDARKLAEKLCEIYRGKIIFGSATPSVETMHKALEKDFAKVDLPELVLPGVPAPSKSIELVDMKKERWKKNYSSLSKKLVAEIEYALKYGKQVILFINKQGMSHFSVCENCKSVLKCPKCDRSLVYASSGSYYCVHCSYKSSIIPQCQKCQGIHFRNIGIGTQKIEKEIADIFSSAKIARADNQTAKESGFHEKLYADFSQGKTDILIGTQMISKGWDFPNVSLVGIIDADSLLSVPDVFSREKAYQNIMQIAGRTGRPGSRYPGKILVQTFNPEQNFFRQIQNNDYLGFYEEEIKDRKNLKMSPFSLVIKLVFQDYKKERVKKETERVFKIMEEKISSKSAVISEPQDSFLSQIRGRHRAQFIIKLLEGKEIPQKIRKILASLPSGWIIDVDPISII